MRNFALILLFLFLSIVSSCAKIDNVEKNFPKDSHSQVLEITSDFQGSWWMNGKVLDFRLYNDGNAEYDEYQIYSSPSGTLQASAIKNLHQIKLKEAELKEISDLLTDDEFSKIKENIGQKKICTDAFVNTEIKTDLNNSTKQILVKNHCAKLSDAKSSEFYFEKFPSKLNRLFEIIRKLKDKDSAGKFYN